MFGKKVPSPFCVADCKLEGENAAAGPWCCAGEDRFRFST